MENFPWTRLEGAPLPNEQKKMLRRSAFVQLDTKAKRRVLGDGNYGGLYQRDDAEMLALWDVAVRETREIIDGGWAS